MSCGINVLELVAVESLADFNDVCACCAEGSIVYVNAENAFYQVQYGQMVKRVYLPFIKRDLNGRAQIVSPAAPDDIANKQYVDQLVASNDGATRQYVNQVVGNTDSELRQYVDAQISANAGLRANNVHYWPQARGFTELYLPAGGTWLWMVSTTANESSTSAGIAAGGSLIYAGHDGSGIAIRLA